jgi:hypothetical protein
LKRDISNQEAEEVEGLKVDSQKSKERKRRKAYHRENRGAAEETETTIFSFSPQRTQRNAKEEWRRKGGKGESGKIR